MPANGEMPASEVELLVLAAVKQLSTPQSVAALRSWRQHDSVTPVAQHNAHPNPPSHIVSAMMARQHSCIRIVDGLNTARIITIWGFLCRERGRRDRSVLNRSWQHATDRVSS